MFRPTILTLTLFLMGSALMSQDLESLRIKQLVLTGDTTQVDTVSIVPGSFRCMSCPEDFEYTVESLDARIIVTEGSPPEKISVRYRVLPVLLTRQVSHRDTSMILPDELSVTDPFKFQASTERNDLFGTSGLDKSGSISRGVTFGNNQDLSVNSNLNLQLSGKISDEIRILASISDNNIPIQPDGNTQQLQDFDQVYIQLFDDKSKLTAGDFWLYKPRGHFLYYKKRSQGASFETQISPEGFKDMSAAEKRQVGSLDIQGSAAISKGKFARNIIQGIEGNQGPYRLKGNDNEPFIIVLSGTERVYIDGELLKRGQENDYVIDYNTAEVTFTPNQVITKDRRIVVEFQYSDKNYARTLFQTSEVYRKKNYEIWFNAYSEQDSKNQPVQQDLDDSSKVVLTNAGDDINSAVINSVQNIGYTNEEVLYKQIDTTIGATTYQDILVYSTNPDSAVYRATFSNVGQGNGNYILEDFTAVGRVFQWVEPVGGVPQGKYEPIRVLVPPKQRQMVSSGAKVDISKLTTISGEVSATHTDLNTFSPVDDQDNVGFGGFFDGKTGVKLGEKTVMSALGTYEFVHRNFNSIERFRSVEFDRDWNIRGKDYIGDQNYAQAGLEYKNQSMGVARYDYETYSIGSDFNGSRNNLMANLSRSGWTLNVNGKLMDSKGQENTSFLRHRGLLKKATPWFVIGYKDEHELNRFFQSSSDSLKTNSYRFYDYEIFITNKDTSKNRFGLSYRGRNNWQSDGETLKPSTLGVNYTAFLDLIKNPNHTFRVKGAYRTLDVLDSTLSSLKDEETILTRIEHKVRLYEGAIRLTTFYEVGSGQELKREFAYLQVQPGQGQYAWIDYNGNDVKELNEFEVAQFQDQAEYIRVFTPTNEYVQTFTNQFNQSLTLKPRLVWKDKEGLLKFLSRFSDQAIMRIDRKTDALNTRDVYNPFLTEVDDTALISLSSSLRNTVFFNRTNTKFGIDHTWQDQRSKSLLSTGFDTRTNTYHELRLRWNVTRQFTFIQRGKAGRESSESEVVAGRNWDITYEELKPELSWQPSTRYRMTALGRYSSKKNRDDLGGETATIMDVGAEVRYNVVSKGSFFAQFNYVRINYTGEENTSLAFEMLDALKNGTNYTWSVNYQRTLSNNIQVNINYNGRASENNPVIHNGGVQVRAFF